VRGSILKPATPAANPMNPNGDGFITSTGGAFTGPLDETEFEIPYVPIAQYQAEPETDNQYSKGCAIYEMVDDGALGAESAYYYTRDPDQIPNNGDEQILFRWRLASWQNGATAFSILIDTDNRFGFSGPAPDPNAITGNPGFEIEIVVANSNPSAVYVLGVDGSSSPTVVRASYSLASRYQVSYALNQDPACSSFAPIFVDTFIDFSALGIPSSTAVRMVAAVNEDIGSCLGGGASDIGGVDGTATPNDDNQFILAINNFPPATIGLVANQAPVGQDAAVSITENSANGMAVHTVSAIDPDDDALSYSITAGNANTAFAINGASGQITVNNSAALDFESTPSYSLTVRASDGGLFDDVVVIINLTNINEAPSAADAVLSMNENSPNGTIVHTLTAIDADAGTVLNYSITGGNTNAAFSINSTSGQITVNNSAALNYEMTPSYSLTLRVTDGSLFDDAVVIVNLANVNETPSAVDGTVSLNENSANGTPVQTVLASDPDAGTILIFSITGGNTGTAFSINSTSGQITVNNAVVLNFEMISSFILTVRVSDGSLFDDATVTVNITNVNEPPSAADATISLNENSVNGTIAHNVSATDPDINTVLNYSIAAGNVNSAFTINNTTGQITVNNSGALNFEATAMYLLTVRVSDGSLFDDAVITVNLNDVNETPSAVGGTTSLTENSTNGTIVYTVSGTDPDAGAVLSYSIIGGNSNAAFAINSTSGQIKVNSGAALNYEVTKSFALVVRVTDGTLSSDALITVNLTDVNETPSAVDGSVALNENSVNGTLVYSVSASDPDAGAMLTYSITGGNTGSTFSIQSSSGQISVSTAATINYEMTTSFVLTVRVSDGILFDDAVVTVNITNVNESPVASDGNISLVENSVNGFLVHTMSASDPDAGAVLTYSITAGNTDAAFSVNSASGQIRVNDVSALNFEKTPVFTLTVRVSDGSLFDDATVKVNLTNVNEMPSGIDGTVLLSENSAAGTVVHSVQASDPDAGTVLNYSIVAGNTNTTFAISNIFGQISVANSAALDFEAAITFTLTVRVTDGSLSDDVSITVNITNVNERPSGEGGTVRLDEGVPDNTVVYQVVGSDPDSGTELSYSFASGNTGGAFAINKSSGEISVDNDAALDFESTPVFTLTVTISDGLLSYDVIVTANLNDINEAPTVEDTELSVDENTANGSTLCRLACADPEGASLSYSIISGNNGTAFTIDDSGVIRVNDSTALNYEASPVFTLTVRVSDGDLSDDGIITVKLVNVNENPVISDGSVSINENSENGASVYHVLASDPDTPVELLRFSIIYGNTDKAFSIDNAGQITVNNASKIDFEKAGSFPLLVEVSDGSLVARGIIIVGLIDVNEAPMADDAVVRIDRSIDNMIIHNVVASDPDEGDVLSFSFENSSYNSIFSIDQNTGAISISDRKELQSAVNPQFQLPVLVSDREGLTGSASIIVQTDNAPIVPLKGFSPDGDGINDFWLIQGIEAFPDNEIKVFNRWGNVVFETRNYDNSEVTWRGESNGGLVIGGKEVVESTYYFIIRVSSLQPITGYVIVKK
jgi:gliding motility-associated-like protein